ncbi:competence type IV pilus minor pilin ComGG [Neobacillus sp.]|jgi:competence protein ComGG|uniref:competence type IV pilus minor pilin ComGG n=1 Tax=Neobacillus sp. TaxID=2675273 RepID=UPI00289EA75D|nr:competence type IV pilus minor pilin ComGG [Neobacillus sp.]
MKNNEKGFTYPLTLCLLLLFLLFFSLHVEQLLTERKMAHETAVILQQEYYFLSSVKKIEGIFQTGGTIPSKGTITYVNGNMDYQAETPTGYVQKVNFTLRLRSDEAIIGRGFFDTRTKKLIKWVELK